MHLKSEFCVFYLDNGTLGGSVEDVLKDLGPVEHMSEDLGLQLNRGKLGMICGDTATRESFLLAASGFHASSPTDASLLSSPSVTPTLSLIPFLRKHLFQTLRYRLPYIHSHDALLLLDYYLAILKVFHLFRTSCFLSSNLVAFDVLLRDILSSITSEIWCLGIRSAV